ncbi:hypothetical protein ACFY9Q_02070 [Streptomyces sp. NPDC012389]|uniref:hypothetical protein n=1 Tax=unclassified Streptomyces TaxID=2593676 RepID=UPI00081DD01B|nr:MULTISPECIES: hypothetical protein [unclassified Streptomyces]MYR97117.1 hypothetical protein [Streptomyces sp. SID4937]SCE21177.1 hypothetical protein GA0115243_108736 [Streptomyces sp. ScaeMP-e83]
MEAAITILALLFVAFIALGVYVTVKAVGAAKRGVDRTITQARRTVEDTTLRAKSFGQPGVAGELAQLRLALRTSMRATQDALHAGVAEDSSLAESVGLFRRLSAHGLELDDELKRLEREPDRATVAGLLPQLRERTQRITHSADSLRWAARDRARQFADDDLDALNAQIDIEAGALRHWTTEEQSGTSQGRSGAGAARGRDAGVEWPEPAAAGASSSTADESWGGPAREEAPQAITAPDPHLRTRYPWQKSARPETTN